MFIIHFLFPWPTVEVQFKAGTKLFRCWNLVSDSTINISSISVGFSHPNVFSTSILILFYGSQHSTWSFPFIRKTSEKHFLREIQKCLLHPWKLSKDTGDLFRTFPIFISVRLYGICCWIRFFYNQSLKVLFLSSGKTAELRQILISHTSIFNLANPTNLIQI